MLLKLHQVSFFCALVEEGSIAAAADKMCCVPSNVSTRIKELEASLGISLVNRDKQRLTLTPEGRAFYPKAQQLLEQSRMCRSFFSHDQLQGTLQLGVLDVALKGRLQAPVIEFMQQNTQVQINISCDSSLPLMEKMLQGELDMILVDGPVQHPALKTDFFAPESLSLVTHLADRQTFAKQAASLTLFSFGEKCFYHQLARQWLSHEHLSFARQSDIESYDMILSAVRKGLGFTVMPESFMRDNPALDGLYHFPLENIAPCDIYLAAPALEQSALANAFYQQLINSPQ
ncbi:LysR family transcriptional regulator [Tatumella saanichensis]|uniref:LysR family transcriptional regulator n=1 Tax=Tatumella saanichensis TaxID=480813 RepID=UPI0004A4554A|nr:LysR family transcriptional regulator [Tatumella saanichensis]